MKKLNIWVVIMSVVLSLPLFAQAQELTVDTENSTVQWIGKKIGGDHSGFINIQSGMLMMEENKIVSGVFSVDMNTISNTDITNETYRDKLIGHLNSDDFFSVEKFPISSMAVTESTPFINDVSMVTADLTIKGITHPVLFEVTREENQFTGEIRVNRALYDIRYGSKTFFSDIGDKAIDDEFILQVILVVE